MKLNYLLIPTLLAFGCILLLQAGCQEKAELAVDSEPSLTVPAKPVTESATEAAPEITFEKLTCDLGEIGPGTKHPCEFRFTNTGDSLLKIKPVQSKCSCALGRLTKREYEPGESGAIKVKSFSAPVRPGTTKQNLFVYSNDEKNPKITLTVKAKVKMNIDYEPKRLKLLLKTENADCAEITLRSVDNEKFAIRRFKSTADCIKADIDPSVEATKFVLQPKVDMKIIQRALNGHVNIGLTHPGCKAITIPYEALPRFKVDPPAVMIYKAEPEKPVTKEIWVLNNYDEDFEIESASSKKGIVKVLTQQRVDKSYKFELQITPPPADDKMRIFMDTFIVNVKGGEKLEIRCRGFYSKK